MSIMRYAIVFILLVGVCLGSAASAPASQAQGEQPFLVVFPAQDGIQAPQVYMALDIDAGYYHSCLVNINHKVFCWGYNDQGQLGNGSASTSRWPVPVSGLSGDAVSVSAGYQHTCAVMASGAAKCWGYGGAGQLGHSKYESSFTPVQVTGLVTTTLSIERGVQPHLRRGKPRRSALLGLQ